MGALNTREEPEGEIEALRASISPLRTANLRISESPGLETVLHEALEPLRQGVHQIPPLGVTHMPSDGCHPFRRGGVTSKGDMILTTTTLISQRADPPPLWFWTFPKRRI